jgi:hypothetical protein
VQTLCFHQLHLQAVVVVVAQIIMVLLAALVAVAV